MEFIDDFTAWVEKVNDVILDAAGSPWIYVLLFGLCIIDGFFPPVPSETVVVALGAVAMTSGVPNLWLVVLLAAAGAIIGDNMAYLIGRSVGTRRFRWMRRAKVADSFAWAGSQLDKRGALLITAGRYIPVGRIAVNMTAGATGYRRVRFFWFSVIAGCSWAVYSVAIGMLAGHWVQDNPFLGVALAVGIALVIGVIVDFINRRLNARRSPKSETQQPSPEPTRL